MINGEYFNDEYNALQNESAKARVIRVISVLIKNNAKLEKFSSHFFFFEAIRTMAATTLATLAAFAQKFFGKNVQTVFNIKISPLPRGILRISKLGSLGSFVSCFRLFFFHIQFGSI